MVDLNCSTINKSMDIEVAGLSDEASSRSESFIEKSYRSEKHKMSQKKLIKKKQLNENEDTSVATDTDLLHCPRFRSVPSIPPSMKEYFDMVKEEYYKKLKTKKKSRSEEKSGKPSYSASKGVFFDKPTKRNAKKEKIGIITPPGNTRHKKAQNQCSGNSNKVKLADSLKEIVSNGFMSRSNNQIDRAVDLDCSGTSLESTQGENSKKSVNELVSHFEKLHRSNAKRKQKKLMPNDEKGKKVPESPGTEELSEIGKKNMNLKQSAANKNKNKMAEGKSSTKGAASSKTEVLNTKDIKNGLARCRIDKMNSDPTFAFNNSGFTIGGTSMAQKVPTNGTKRSKFTTTNSKSPASSDIQAVRRKAKAKVAQSKCKKDKRKKFGKGNNTKKSIGHSEQPRNSTKNNQNNNKSKKKGISKTILKVVAIILLGLFTVELVGTVMGYN